MPSALLLACECSLKLCLVSHQTHNGGPSDEKEGDFLVGVVHGGGSEVQVAIACDDVYRVSVSLLMAGALLLLRVEQAELASRKKN